ncbi:interferon-inducible double-stranded RNA-dependent protein kinase activator A homolog A-like [Ctenocephalides felis]|uniref:interferon-inducible double-stranded RNA-dependent protein kinase activator A homolog A-like n=1 Tax=Ctenocephalides felis TaxID=7515 RepID=UPI000E6E199F|nr:interferon-inducible double-stranded RNA-dependent protein kinase activator A homolog A-like [Ctenocephalides felis]
MSQETPVTVLVNFCSAKKTPAPKFNLIRDGTGTRNPIFIYEVRVTVNEIEVRVVGSGKSKKEAKQESARLALTKLSEINLIESPVLEDKETVEGQPSTTIPVAVRKLSQFCDKNGLPIPVYNLIEETGPSHAKQYTMECTVSTFKERATASSKQAAKHVSSEAVFLILQKIDLDKHIKKHVKVEPINAAMIPKIEKLREESCAQEIEMESIANNYHPFAKCGEKKCKLALSILYNDLLTAEEKMKEALKALNVTYQLSEELMTLYNVMGYTWSTTSGTDPQLTLQGFSWSQLYKTVNEYMSEFLKD